MRVVRQFKIRCRLHTPARHNAQARRMEYTFASRAVNLSSALVCLSIMMHRVWLMLAKPSVIILARFSKLWHEGGCWGRYSGKGSVWRRLKVMITSMFTYFRRGSCKGGELKGGDENCWFIGGEIIWFAGRALWLALNGDLRNKYENDVLPVGTYILSDGCSARHLHWRGRLAKRTGDSRSSSSRLSVGFNIGSSLGNIIPCDVPWISLSTVKDSKGLCELDDNVLPDLSESKPYGT